MRRLSPVLAFLLLAGCADTGGGDETARKWVVFFRQDDATVSRPASIVVATAAQVARRHPDRGLVVAGFAAAHGNIDADQALSSDRADAVAAALRASGVPANQITEHARPPANEAPAVAARRVEISFAPVP
ncbi:MAG: OmpA family protein [Gluconacetobacter diazotrophicus]|nr:OmpA family protein [Gluconacetobacter diazotrophicus]